jgi:hypothetical protein
MICAIGSVDSYSNMRRRNTYENSSQFTLSTHALTATALFSTITRVANAKHEMLRRNRNKAHTHARARAQRRHVRV